MIYCNCMTKLWVGNLNPEVQRQTWSHKPSLSRGWLCRKHDMHEFGKEGPGHLSSSHCTLMASWPKQISGGKRLFAPLVTLRVWQRCWMGMWGKLVKEVNTKPKVTFPGGTKPSLYVERHSCKETRTNLVCDSGFTTCPHPHHLSSQGSFITRHLLQISATQRSIHEW